MVIEYNSTEGTYEGELDEEMDENIASMIKFAEEHIEDPICYQFLRYAYAPSDYPKLLGEHVVLGPGDPGLKPIKATFEMLKKMSLLKDMQ